VTQRFQKTLDNMTTAAADAVRTQAARRNVERAAAGIAIPRKARVTKRDAATKALAKTKNRVKQ
jgi:hypothetical protein